MSLLNVHLKSGCYVDNVNDSDREACLELAKQVPVLDNWIENKETSDLPSMINTGAQLSIDHVFMGNITSAEIEYQAKIHPFEDVQVDAMLSDHCALSATLRYQYTENKHDYP